MTNTLANDIAELLVANCGFRDSYAQEVADQIATLAARGRSDDEPASAAKGAGGETADEYVARLRREHPDDGDHIGEPRIADAPELGPA